MRHVVYARLSPHPEGLERHELDDEPLASIMVSATQILASGVSWPRKNTEFHGIIK